MDDLVAHQITPTCNPNETSLAFRHPRSEARFWQDFFRVDQRSQQSPERARRRSIDTIATPVAPRGSPRVSPVGGGADPTHHLGGTDSDPLLTPPAGALPDRLQWSGRAHPQEPRSVLGRAWMDGPGSDRRLVGSTATRLLETLHLFEE